MSEQYCTVAHTLQCRTNPITMDEDNNNTTQNNNNNKEEQKDEVSFSIYMSSTLSTNVVLTMYHVPGTLVQLVQSTK